MKKYKVCGNAYSITEAFPQEIDGYAINGKLVDEQPKGKFFGYIRMEDGSNIACYKTKPIVPILLLVVLLVLVAVAGVIYLLCIQPKDVVIGVGDSTHITLRQGTDNNVVSYNGFSTLRDNSIDLNFQNGDYPCTILVYGEGIESTVVEVAANAYVTDIPVTFTTEYGLVQATLEITTSTSTITQPFVIEIPENNTPNNPQPQLDGYWRGEFIYVPATESN